MAARAEPAGPGGEGALTPRVPAVPGVRGCHTPCPELGSLSRLPAPAPGAPVSTRTATSGPCVPSEGTGISSSGPRTDPPVPQLAAAVPAAGVGDRPGDTHGRRAEQPSPAAAPRNPWCQTNLFRPCDPVTQPAGGGNARDGKYPDGSEALDPACHQPASPALNLPWARIRGEEEP